MTFFTVFISFLFGFFPAMLVSNLSNTQSSARDVSRKKDINSIHQKLEEHYNEYGEYPTEKELTIDSEDQLPGLDAQSLIDPDGNFIQEGDYKYEPTGCTAIGCSSYTLSTILETEDTYIKNSLN